MRSKWWEMSATMIIIIFLIQSVIAQNTVDTRYNPLDPFRKYENNTTDTSYDPNRYNSQEQNNINPFNRDPTINPNRIPGQNQNYPNNRNPAQNYPNRIDNVPRPRPSYNQQPTTSSRENVVLRDATYFIVASRMIRPGLVYQVSVSVLETLHPITVRASISRNGVEMSGDLKAVHEGVPETLLMRVPTTSVPGEYRLRIEGQYSNMLGGIAFENETKLTFSQRSMTIFVQTDKPAYMQGETIVFRIIPITIELKGFDSAIDVYMLDPRGHILRRWLSRQSNLGTVGLSYKLSDQPSYGKWMIRVVAQGQIEEATFEVEEYYQTRFEVNVTMPAYFFKTDPWIHGKVMANFTSGVPARGNLTIKATIRPLGFFNYKANNDEHRIGRARHHSDGEVDKELYNGIDRSQYENRFPNQFQDVNTDQQQQYQSTQYQDPYSVERHFSFDEDWPFWMEKPENFQTYDYRDRSYKNALPYLRFFNGTFDFKFPMYELEQAMPNVPAIEVMITATVGEKFYDEVISGYSITRVYNSSIKLSFLGESPQVFKPAMPFTAYLVAEYHDSSPISFNEEDQGQLEVTGYIESQFGRREYPSKILRMSDKAGIWIMNIDLRNDLNLDETRSGREFLTGVQTMKLQASYIDRRGERAQTELLLLSHYSPKNSHIKVSTSTQSPAVGEYIIFHIRTNYFIEFFNYLVMSKGVILLIRQESIRENIRTIAVPVSAEMAPTATIVVWSIIQQGQVMADSLTFPVNGISRNNFTIYINNRKARTGESVEVAIYGEPGSYVGLSGIDNAFYTVQAGNDLTYAKVITKMSSFDEQSNGTYKHTWYSHAGDPDELVYYPASSFGIDANRTFEYAGLVVFTDGEVPRRFDNCNVTLGLAECLSGTCYRIEKKCDGFMDCIDGTDEINCSPYNETANALYRKYRFNRVQRHYDNVWLWKDMNIGPHGRYIFSIEVPNRPAHWMVSAFSISPTTGFGMLRRPVEYIGERPFFINVEMPTESRQGEQVGIRVSVFNYMTTAVEATVILEGSPDYKFVHVEEDGIVRSYNPRTSFGEHQFFVYLPAQDTTVVYIPIVPTRLGDIDITVYAQSLIGSNKVTRRLHVEADGLPQYRHQSILLDLSNRAYVFQYMHVNITETPIIPYEVERYFVYGSNRARISVVGDVVGPIFPTMPVNATSLLYMPMDSAEQNMFSFAANLYTVLYMRLINQRNRETERQAFYHMNEAYQRQLSFMKEDGSFTLFRSDWNNSDSSVWLTAYCARIFQEASFYEWENYIFIDPLIIQKSVRWLLRHQTHEGSFYDVTWLPDRKMDGNKTYVPEMIKHRNISLTAHVLITLASIKDLSGNLGPLVSIAQQKAILWIERNMQILKNSKEPYEVAIVAYALMLVKASNAEQAFRYLNTHMRKVGEFIYWGNVEIDQPPSKLENQKYFSLPRLPYEFDTLNIETTAYALLVYVPRQYALMDSIVRWLNAQRLNDGGWASTQDTSVALKALVEYTAHSQLRDVSQLTVSVEATSLPGQTKTLYINKQNLAKLQSIDIPNAWGTVKVQAKGAGYAILQMHVQYNVDIEKFQTKPPVPAFDLSVRPIFHGRNQSHITVLSCQRWINMNESFRSGMAVLDLTIPTGYFVQQQKLDSYVLSSRVRNLQKARYQERKVLFYFEYLDNEDICVNITVERWYPVANMSRYLPIRVYDYYAPERFNETIFDALPTYLLNICEVCGSSQCPYCSIYNFAVRTSLSISLFVTAIVFHKLFSLFQNV